MTNSLLILNKRRFLSKFSLFADPASISGSQVGGRERGTSDSIKGQVAGLFAAVDYLKVPVIAMNVFTIVFELILGGT